MIHPAGVGFVTYDAYVRKFGCRGEGLPLLHRCVAGSLLELLFSPQRLASVTLSYRRFPAPCAVHLKSVRVTLRGVPASAGLPFQSHSRHY